eukprot:3372040-Rhodomonas_salina.1
MSMYGRGRPVGAGWHQPGPGSSLSTALMMIMMVRGQGGLEAASASGTDPGRVQGQCTQAECSLGSAWA